jgi:biotin transport system substrate-specific component
MVTSLTYADILRPCAKKYSILYDVVLVIGGSLLIGLSAQIAVKLPFSPVPITCQTLAVLMAGALLGRVHGSLCVLAYITEGAAGLPVFALGRSGLAVLAGPSGGYLIGFAVAAYITGFLAEKGWDRRFSTTILAMLLGNATIYTVGLLWLVILTGMSRAVLMAGLYPFVVGDILKTMVAAAVLPGGWKLLAAAGFAAEKIK